MRKSCIVLLALVVVLTMSVVGGGVARADDPYYDSWEYQYDVGESLYIQLPTVQSGVKRMILQSDGSDRTVVLKRTVASTANWVTTDTSTESVGSYTVTAPQEYVDPNDPNQTCCCWEVSTADGEYIPSIHDCEEGGNGSCEMIWMECTCAPHICTGPGHVKLMVPTYW